jgi:hypothetical protein
VRHLASPAFWDAYNRLPENVRKVADRSFEILKQNPRDPALHFKQVGRYWSARVGLGHRALGVDTDGDVVWFWIGSHADYDRLLKR